MLKVLADAPAAGGYSAVSTVWVLVGAALVFFMQAGFAMVETGFTRAKNAGNIIMKNLMDFCIGTPIFWLVGFGIMFGSGSFIGAYKGIAAESAYGAVSPDGVPFFAYFIFQTVFCATAATIVSGAMAERTKFISYCIYSAAISLIVYPIEAHWIWGGGWLSEMGFHDFAGSTCVHMAGGVAAFVGAAILGPRIGNTTRTARPGLSPDTTLPLAPWAALSCGSAGSALTEHPRSPWRARLLAWQERCSPPRTWLRQLRPWSA